MKEMHEKNIPELEEDLKDMVSVVSEIKDLDQYQDHLSDITRIVTLLYRMSEEYRDDHRLH